MPDDEDKRELCWVLGKTLGFQLFEADTLIDDLNKYKDSFSQEKLSERYELIESEVKSLYEKVVSSMNNGCIIIDYKTPVMRDALNNVMMDMESRDTGMLFKDFNIFRNSLPNFKTIREQEGK